MRNKTRRIVFSSSWSKVRQAKELDDGQIRLNAWSISSGNYTSLRIGRESDAVELRYVSTYTNYGQIESLPYCPYYICVATKNRKDAANFG